MTPPPPPDFEVMVTIWCNTCKREVYDVTVTSLDDARKAWATGIALAETHDCRAPGGTTPAPPP